MHSLDLSCCSADEAGVTQMSNPSLIQLRLERSQRGSWVLQVGGAAMAVLDKEATAIQFGAEGLTILLQGSGEDARKAKSRLGSYYAKGPNGQRSLFAAADGLKAASLVQLKVMAESKHSFLSLLICNIFYVCILHLVGVKAIWQLCP